MITHRREGRGRLWVTTLTVEVRVFTVITESFGNVICRVCGRVSEEAKVVA